MKLEERACPEVNLSPLQCCHLRYSCTAVVHRQQQGVIPSARPLGSIWNSQDGIDLLAGEITNEFLVFALNRYGEDACGDANAVGISQGHHPKEGPYSGKPDIARPHGIAALLFKTVKER